VHWKLGKAFANPPEGTSLLGQLEYLLLPAIAMVFAYFGYIARMTRAGVITALQADYTRTATMKGLSNGQVMRRHVLRNALAPTITVISVQIGYLIGGIIGVEKVFNYAGLGSTMLSAVGAKDIPVLQGAVLLVGIVYMLSTLLADLLIAASIPVSVWRPSDEHHRAASAAGPDAVRARHARHPRQSTCRPWHPPPTSTSASRPGARTGAHPQEAGVPHRLLHRAGVGRLCACSATGSPRITRSTSVATAPVARWDVPVRHRLDRPRRAVTCDGRCSRRAADRPAGGASWAWCSASSSACSWGTSAACST
jgi:hypothetical protein